MIGTHYTKSLGTFIMIAWRNLWRQKRRSLVVISSMAIGVFAMVFSIGFMNGMTLQMVENTINTTLGHISIHRVGYRDSMKLKYNFSPDEGRYRAIEETPGVVAFAPRVKIKGMISSAETTRGVMLVGIDPTRERSVSSIGDYILPEDGGRFIQDPAAEEVLISKSLAEKLDLRVGERAVLRVVDESSEMTGVGLRIAGLYESPVESFDSFVIFTGITQLQKITGIGDNVSEIIVRTKNRDSVDAVKKRMKGAGGPGIEILTWKEMEPNLVSYIKLQDMVIYIFFMIMFITVIFSIANTLIMSIMERFHELGVMKCIGTRPSHIFFMVIFEAVNLGIVGLAAGLAITVPLVLILGATGLDFSFAMEAMRKWKIGTTIYPMLLAKDIIAAVAVVLITTVTASIYPAVKAARIKPLEALHFI